MKPAIFIIFTTFLCTFSIANTNERIQDCYNSPKCINSALFDKVIQLAPTNKVNAIKGLKKEMRSDCNHMETSCQGGYLLEALNLTLSNKKTTQDICKIDMSKPVNNNGKVSATFKLYKGNTLILSEREVWASKTLKKFEELVEENECRSTSKCISKSSYYTFETESKAPHIGNALIGAGWTKKNYHFTENALFVMEAKGLCHFE